MRGPRRHTHYPEIHPLFSHLPPPTPSSLSTRPPPHRTFVPQPLAGRPAAEPTHAARPDDASTPDRYTEGKTFTNHVAQPGPGGFLQEGIRDDLELLAGTPLGPKLVSSQRQRLNRWNDLAGVSVRLRLVMATTSSRILSAGVGNPKHAATRAVERLQEDKELRAVGCEIQDHTTRGSGPPQNILNIVDLKRNYPSLS